MTLVKLKLDLRERDLAYQFGVAVSVVSKYFITWVCFMYCHLREVEWVPSVEQVQGTLPLSFKEKYPNTYIILDASEVFIQMPTDLHLQSNTSKFLVGCTPNGAVSFISPDTQLTSMSGLMEKSQIYQSWQIEGSQSVTSYDP